jgi:hypothetical protein
MTWFSGRTTKYSKFEIYISLIAIASISIVRSTILNITS